jgi:hypothetical protein
VTDKDALHQRWRRVWIDELAGLTEKSNGGELRVANKMLSQSHESESRVVQLTIDDGIRSGCKRLRNAGFEE